MTDDALREAMTVDHIGVDLWLALRAYEEAMFEGLAQAGYGDLTLADSDVLAFVGPDGTRITDVARSRRITKQAAQEQVRKLVDRAYLTVGPDPKDRRARRVTLTAKGRALMLDLVAIKRRLNDAVEGALGRDAARLREDLARARQALG